MRGDRVRRSLNGLLPRTLDPRTRIAHGEQAFGICIKDPFAIGAIAVSVGDAFPLHSLDDAEKLQRYVFWRIFSNMDNAFTSHGLAS